MMHICHTRYSILLAVHMDAILMTSVIHRFSHFFQIWPSLDPVAVFVFNRSHSASIEYASDANPSIGIIRWDELKHVKPLVSLVQPPYEWNTQQMLCGGTVFFPFSLRQSYTSLTKYTDSGTSRKRILQPWKREAHLHDVIASPSSLRRSSFVVRCFDIDLGFVAH